MKRKKLKRGRGRPKGSGKKKIFDLGNQSGNYLDDKEIKKEIKRLRRLKLQCRAGTKERVDLHRQVKELRRKIEKRNKPDPERDLLIEKMLKLTPSYVVSLNINYKKFTIEQLQFHLNRLIQKRQGRSLTLPKDNGVVGQVEGKNLEPDPEPEQKEEPEPNTGSEPVIKTRGRGRPKGSKNKLKEKE